MNISAKAYFTIGGLKDNEGVVITRNADYVVETSSLSDKRWYVIETNYDRSNLEPISDVRKTYAILRLELLGQSDINE